jgi:CHAT domain
VLFYAGARALLVPHWSVDSEAGTELTTSTFAIMKVDPKLGRTAALRNAMLAYMNDKSSPLNAYPAFWAPFSIIGEGAARCGAESRPPQTGAHDTEAAVAQRLKSSQRAYRVRSTPVTGRNVAIRRFFSLGSWFHAFELLRGSPKPTA